MSAMDSFMFGYNAFVMIGIMALCLLFIITTNSIKPVNVIARFQMVALATITIAIIGSISINCYLIVSNLRFYKDSKGIRIVQKSLSEKISKSYGIIKAKNYD